MIGKCHERFNRSVVLAATIYIYIVTAIVTATTAGTVQLQHLLIITTTIILLFYYYYFNLSSLSLYYLYHVV